MLGLLLLWWGGDMTSVTALSENIVFYAEHRYVYGDNRSVIIDIT